MGQATYSVSLVEQLVSLYVPPGGLVLDPFGGSGTTVIACQRSGRRGCSIDIDPASVDWARERYLKIFGRFGLMENSLSQCEPGGMEARSAAGVVSASMAAAACGISRYDTASEYYAQRRDGSFKPDTPDMAAGREMEETVAQNAARLLGWKKMRTPGTFFHLTEKWLCGTPDRLPEDEGVKGTTYLECKHSLRILQPRPLLEHVFQVTVCLGILGQGHGYLAYGCGNRTRVFRIEFSEALWKWAEVRLREFKRCLDAGIDPAATVPQLGALAATAWSWDPPTREQEELIASWERRWGKRNGTAWLPPRPRWTLVAEDDGKRPPAEEPVCAPPAKKAKGAEKKKAKE